MSNLVDEVFSRAFAPYTIPVVAFASNTGDSSIFMIREHSDLDRKTIATFAWYNRVYQFRIDPDRPLDTLAEFGYATFEQVTDDDFSIEIHSQEVPESHKVTYIEI